MKTLAALALAIVALGACASDAPPTLQAQAEAWRPIIKGAHFHHVHLNVTDRKAAIAFYEKHFDAKAEVFAGTEDAVWVQRSWLLFNEVSERPPSSEGTAINHMGWSTPDAHAEFARQKMLDAPFNTEIRNIGGGLGARDPSEFAFMYLEGPNGELIEINTGEDNNFGHIHFFGRQPHTASLWYANMFGLTDAPPVFPYHVAPAGTERMSRRLIDNVSTIFSSRQGEDEMKPTRGTVFDHIAISVPDLDVALTAIEPYGVPVLAGPAIGGPGWRHAFIEGPDRIAIELIEDRTRQPQITN